MTTLSNLTSGKSITPGKQIVSAIATRAIEGNATLLLREIAKQAEGSRISRIFPDTWENEAGMQTKRGVIKFGDQEFPIIAMIGLLNGSMPETLFLENVSGDGCSMQPVNGNMVLHVGEKISLQRLGSLASQVTGTWIVHGEDWYDRKNQFFRKPWGKTKRGIYEKFCFEVIDGSLEDPAPKLEELIERGCRRSTHVGEWHKRHSTIIPAVVGMPMTIHEFKHDGGPDICQFNGLEIGHNPEMWGPCCPWNEAVRHSDQLGMWQDLALRCASPFNFHVHATRTLFPAIQLDSDYLLQAVGKEKLRGILEVMVANQPGRFYRLIDECGLTHRHIGVSDTLLNYGGHGYFPRSEVVDNIIQTFLELQMVQADPAYHLPRRHRLVIDSHAYIVIETMARKQSVSYELSGRYMHQYLTDGTDARMHRVRNEELFLLLRDFFGLQNMKLHVYPPLRWNSGLNSQYDENLKFCDHAKYNWLSTRIC